MLKNDIVKCVNAVRYHDLIPFLNEIKRINYCVIKGAALSTLAYGLAEIRNSVDIDLLFNKKDLKFFLGNLKNMAFTIKTRRELLIKKNEFFAFQHPSMENIGEENRIYRINR